SLREKPEKILEEPEMVVIDDVCGPETPNRSTELSKEHGNSHAEPHFPEHPCSSNVKDLTSSKFPKSAHNFVNALKKNRSCQKFIRRKLLEIEAKIEKNKELKERVKCLMDFQVACKRKVANILYQKNDPRVTLISLKRPTSEKSSKVEMLFGKEEDAKLRAAVEYYGDNWQMVASCLEGRVGPQCSNRWNKTLNPERKKVGRWSVDEDKRLKVAVMLFGAKNWNKIAQFAPGRTQVQCRER
ncbi:hypothetical protein GW17_00025564, partial [Ensete ventricosum]